MNPDLKAATERLRKMAIQCDADNHFLREQAFHRWKLETVIHESVIRWIATIGARPCSKP